MRAPRIPVSAFDHDRYRAIGGGRFWVMERQTGPVHWAPWNPVPAKGMVRLKLARGRAPDPVGRSTEPIRQRAELSAHCHGNALT
ncbi:beta-galactosidase-like protein [Paraburkholderia sp. BL18I3N2]|nr:beta-galactosidase-like protein [Paraburkholderia sp. BL18I3N2]